MNRRERQVVFPAFLNLRSAQVAVFAFLVVLFAIPAFSFSAAQSGNNETNGAERPFVIKSIAILPFENLTESQVAPYIVKDDL